MLAPRATLRRKGKGEMSSVEHLLYARTQSAQHNAEVSPLYRRRCQGSEWLSNLAKQDKGVAEPVCKARPSDQSVLVGCKHTRGSTSLGVQGSSGPAPHLPQPPRTESVPCARHSLVFLAVDVDTDIAVPSRSSQSKRRCRRPVYVAMPCRS